MLNVWPEGNVSADHNYGQMLMYTGMPVAVVDYAELRFSFLNQKFHHLFPEISVNDTLDEYFSSPFLKNWQQYFTHLTGTADNFQIPVTSRFKKGVEYNLAFSPNKKECGEVESLLIWVSPLQRTPVYSLGHFADQFENPIVILKGENMILEVANKALLSLWNVSEEAIGSSLLHILPEIKEQGFLDLLLDVYNNGKTHRGTESEFYFKRSNGDAELHYFDFIYQPYRDNNEEITGVLVIATDVTSQVNAKRRQAFSDSNFRNMILQAPVAMCILKGSDYIVEIANEKMFELWGKHPGELAGKPIFDALPEAKGQGLEDLLNNVIKTGIAFTANERAVDLPRNNQTETRYLNFVYEPFAGEGGIFTGIIAVATDVTEQVLIRKEIQLAEESARLAIDSAGLGTYEINYKTNEMVTSERFREIWGMKYNTTNRADYASRIHPDDVPVRELAHKTSNRTGFVDYEARIIREGDSIKWVKIKGKIIYNQNAEPEKLIGVIQDITEQKQAARLLSEKIEERTRELQEANESLEKSNAELEQFAYVTSHDLQEPLRKIQFFTNTALQQHEMPPALRTYVEKANESAKRMTDLIRGLLEYSRLSQQFSHLQVVDLNEVVSNVLMDFELMITQKHASIQTENLPVLTAIPLQMNQLFFNLIGNALKFTRKEVPPSIRITCTTATAADIQSFEKLDKDRKYFMISVIDNGIGFSNEYAEQIFTIFQRLNERAKYAGYGIGLAVCKKIVDNHEGIMYARGKVMEGANFTFLLPSDII